MRVSLARRRRRDTCCEKKNSRLRILRIPRLRRNSALSFFRLNPSLGWTLFLFPEEGFTLETIRNNQKQSETIKLLKSSILLRSLCAEEGVAALRILLFSNRRISLVTWMLRTWRFKALWFVFVKPQARVIALQEGAAGVAVTVPVSTSSAAQGISLTRRIL